MTDGPFLNQRGTVHLRDHTEFVMHKKQFTGDITFFQRVVRITYSDNNYFIPYENIVYIEMEEQPTVERY